MWCAVQSRRATGVCSPVLPIVVTTAHCGPLLPQLWLPQVLNIGLSHQCTCFSHVRAGALTKVYQTCTSPHLFDTLVTGMALPALMSFHFSAAGHGESHLLSESSDLNIVTFFLALYNKVFRSPDHGGHWHSFAGYNKILFQGIIDVCKWYGFFCARHVPNVTKVWVPSLAVLIPSDHHQCPHQHW